MSENEAEAQGASIAPDDRLPRLNAGDGWVLDRRSVDGNKRSTATSVVNIPWAVLGSWDGVAGPVQGLRFGLEAQYDPDSARFRVTSLEVTGAEVTTSVLRLIPLKRSVRELVAWTVGSDLRSAEGSKRLPDVDVCAFLEPNRGWDGEAMRAQRDAERARRAIGDDRTLEQVALVYWVAELSDEPPAKAVERVFQLEPRTASNWIRRARERGAFDWRDRG